VAPASRKKVHIIEMGPRDGLQNEAAYLRTEEKVEFVKRLYQSGLRQIEIAAFVSPKWVPQMADSRQVATKVLRWARAKAKDSSNLSIKNFSALVPNAIGAQAAIDAGLKRVAFFMSASEGFSQANTNCSVTESLERFSKIIETVRGRGVQVRGYLSVCFFCPFDGAVDPKKVVRLSQTLLKKGCYEVSIGDTIGAATPGHVERLIKILKTSQVDINKIAMHFHDTRGTALANALKAYEMGVRTFDASVGGLGGCPYAPGAAGNVGTEDLVYMFEGMGINTGIDLPQLRRTKDWISKKVGRELPSRVSRVGLPRGW